MRDPHRHQIWLLFVSALLLSISSSSVVSATAQPLVNLPSCGSDPSANTLMLQTAIDKAVPNTTLVLAPGVCVVAKCDVARGAICYGAAGLPHRSALHLGIRSALTLKGASDGTSVLKLDPHPPGLPGRHAYCGDTHVLSLQGSSFITLRGFTIDGSDGELPEDPGQCPTDPHHDGRIAERMFDLYVMNSTDITIDHMHLIKAHGDGLNLMAEQNRTNIPRTERVSVTNTQFLDNDRSGLAFQRNVGFVTISGNYFRDSGGDQDLDMEPTGGPSNLGPYNVTIDHNLFERIRPGITVTIGANGTQWTNHVSFTNNTIRSASCEDPSLNCTPEAMKGEGGCVFVYEANNTTIANNTIIGSARCVTLAAQKVTGLNVSSNRLVSYSNVQDTRTGRFVPRPVISISERVVRQGDAATCGVSPNPPCPYHIYYPDRITITGNSLIQHVQLSPGVSLSNASAVLIANNRIVETKKIAPNGSLTPDASAFRATGINLPFGVRELPSYGYYENERMEFGTWQIKGNGITEFADGIRLSPVKKGLIVTRAAINENLFNTKQKSPQGIWLVNIPGDEMTGYIDYLIVNSNRFGCGFQNLRNTSLPPWAYVHPQGQMHTGDIGYVTTCQ